MYSAVRAAKNEMKNLQIIFSFFSRQYRAVSLIQRAARITAQTQLLNGHTRFSRLYLSVSLTHVSVLLEILVTSSCGSYSVHPWASLTLKRKVWVQRPCLAIAPTFKHSGSRDTQLSPTSRGSGEYLNFQGTTTHIVLHWLQHLSP